MTGAQVCTRRSTLKVTCRRARERVIEEESSQMAETNKQSFKVSSGEKSPLGVSQVDKGINFALFSHNATSVTLCLSLPQRLKSYVLFLANVMSQLLDFKLCLCSLVDSDKEDDVDVVELVLDPSVNKTGDTWHICVEVVFL